jgi:hypothetical protein
MENNNEIINNIREIYRTAPSNKIHQLISKHFIPSIDEKKKNADGFLYMSYASQGRYSYLDLINIWFCF